MGMMQLFPRFKKIDASEVYSDLQYPHSEPDRPHTVVNMVTTVDGKAVIGMRAHNIGSCVDHVLMRKIRTPADALMVGAGSLRAETIDPRVPEPLQTRRTELNLPSRFTAIVVTASCDLPLHQDFFRYDGVDRIVFTTHSASAEKVKEASGYARVIRLGDVTVGLDRMMRLLACELGIGRVVVEGGPTLNGRLVALGLVDEIFWTAAPKIAAGVAEKTMIEGEPFSIDRIAKLELLSAYCHESELYLRYRLRRSPEHSD
jgi:riboflavin-specific deaminase-like protein